MEIRPKVGIFIFPSVGSSPEKLFRKRTGTINISCTAKHHDRAIYFPSGRGLFVYLERLSNVRCCPSIVSTIVLQRYRCNGIVYNHEIRFLRTVRTTEFNDPRTRYHPVVFIYRKYNYEVTNTVVQAFVTTTCSRSECSCLEA